MFFILDLFETASLIHMFTQQLVEAFIETQTCNFTNPHSFHHHVTLDLFENGLSRPSCPNTFANYDYKQLHIKATEESPESLICLL